MSEEADLQQCEHCDKEFPIETMTSMEDCWFCEGCVAEWEEVFNACEHQWNPEPYVSTMGEEGRICDRCHGFVANNIVYGLVLANPQEGST